MAFNPEISGFGKRVSPELQITAGDFELVLTWHNTQLNVYNEGDEMFNHVIHDSQYGRHMLFVDSEMCDLLIDREFPHFIRPIVDEETIQMYAKIHAAAADCELGVLLGNQED
jgi:hypothetical protein